MNSVDGVSLRRVPHARKCFVLAPLVVLAAGVSSAFALANPATNPSSAHRRESRTARFVDARHGSLAVKTLETLSLSGAPSAADVAALKEAGFVAILDVRQSAEDRSELQAAAAAQGLTYRNEPLFQADGAIDAKAVDAISAFHEAHAGVPHLVSCKSGNRSSAWYALHAVRRLGLSPEAALLAARQAFLRDDMAEAVRAFLVAHPPRR